MKIPKSIVVYGSGSAYGKNDIEGGGFAGRLRRWHEEVDIQNKTFNLGVPGASIDHLLDRVATESSHRKADLIILQLGANDARRDGTAENDPLTPIDEFQEKYDQLLNELVAIAPTIVVSVYPIDESKTTPVSWGELFFFGEDIAAYESEMRASTLRAGIEYVDIYGEWQAMPGSAAKFLDKDGLHANSAGHEYIFEKIRDQLLSTYDGEER